MKKVMLHGVILFFAMTFLHGCGSTRSSAEKEKLAAEIAQAVEIPDFTFKATYAYPTGYRSLYLSPYYDVKVTADTVKVYLPYYGRAYRAPIDPSEGGYRFISADFEYRTTEGKRKGNRGVEIIIHDQHRLVTFRFDIWDNGKARLDVSDVDRQPISFQGEITMKE